MALPRSVMSLEEKSGAAERFQAKQFKNHDLTVLLMVRNVFEQGQP